MESWRTVSVGIIDVKDSRWRHMARFHTLRLQRRPCTEKGRTQFRLVARVRQGRKDYLAGEFDGAVHLSEIMKVFNVCVSQTIPECP